MKLIIAGSRNLELDINFFMGLLDYYYSDLPITDSGPGEVITGGCPTGIDKIAKDQFEDNYTDIVYKEFPADWAAHGKAAGPLRNKQMAQYGDVLLVIWDGESKGSKNMKEEMLKLNKPVYEVILRSYNGQADQW